MALLLNHSSSPPKPKRETLCNSSVNKNKKPKPIPKVIKDFRVIFILAKSDEK
jgi:hypothetical protein